MGDEITTAGRDVSRTIGKIPVRNLWFLYLYASDLAKFQGTFDGQVEESPDFPELIARLLCYAVERRLRRNLSRGYRRQEAVLSRVRGRIDVLETTTQGLLKQGKVACRFEELSIDTPRNRLVHAALLAAAPYLTTKIVAHRCRKLAADLAQMGVSRVRPSRSEIAADQMGRNDTDDQLMVSLARLVFDLVLPTEEEGSQTFSGIEREERIVRHLFEKAVGNFLAAEMSGNDGWRVYQGQKLYWAIEAATAGIRAILPNMKTDIVLENPAQGSRVVIDTKFTEIVATTAYRDAVLKSGYIYQMYAYLRSQEESANPLSLDAEGILLHPTVHCDLDETVRIQGHDIRFLTVDLALPTADIVKRLRAISVRRPRLV
jgi:5-methylcytosine-specific restriction enzyme subunit McrC